jgi:hypothetical protein
MLFNKFRYALKVEGPSWSWSYYIWIYNYICNQCMSPLMLWVWISSGRGVLDTKLCDKVCLWLATGRWFTPVTPVDSTNKTDPHDDIAELLLKVALNSINKQTNYLYKVHVITIYFNSYIYVFTFKAYLNLLNNIIINIILRRIEHHAKQQTTDLTNRKHEKPGEQPELFH